MAAKSTAKKAVTKAVAEENQVEPILAVPAEVFEINFSLVSYTEVFDAVLGRRRNPDNLGFHTVLVSVSESDLKSPGVFDASLMLPTLREKYIVGKFACPEEVEIVICDTRKLDSEMTFAL